jgi:geranylgeranyl pyrophosphate synthase
MPFCCGIEFIHTFSLIHDDLPSMDDDDFRRARPSLHRRFDEATAILAADGLFALAFELFARAPGSPARKLSAVSAICAAVGPAGMTGGQFLDISARPGLSARAVAGIHQRKTAAFIAASLVAGATVAGARPASLRRLHRAGIQLGLLFQLTDDLLDRVQPSDHRLPTMVTCHGLAGARRIAARAAALAESGFLSLGPGYEQLARIPALVQTRRS